MSGVFNSQAHQEEISLLVGGRLKQFQIVPVSLANAGPAQLGGDAQGTYQAEGTGLMVLNSFMNNDQTILTSIVGAPVYVRFNHSDNPWLPLGIPDPTRTTVQPWPSSYALTIGQFWVNVPPASVSANGVIYLLLVKSVSIFCAGTFGGAGEIGTYAPPGFTGWNPWSGMGTGAAPAGHK